MKKEKDSKLTIDQKHVINQIMADMFIYQDPKLLMAQYQGIIDTSKTNKKALERYMDLFHDISYAFKKVLRYKIYFKYFYSTDVAIGKIEALNHHIHAYLEDMITLKNKIAVLLGEAKNNIKRLAVNKNDVDQFFSDLVDKTEATFNQVATARNPHRHRGKRFMDGDLLKAENAEGFLEQISDPVVDRMLNQSYKPTLIEKFTKEKQQSFAVAQQRWIKMAENNDKQIVGCLDTILNHIKPTLYQYLGIKVVRNIIKKEVK